MKENIQIINELVINVLDSSTKKEGTCLYMGALLFAQINDNLKIKSKLVVGTLTVSNKLVFSHKPIQPLLKSEKDFSGKWDGHAWVEVEGIIIDPSVFWTINSPEVSPDFRKLFEKTFKGTPDYLIGSRVNLEKIGVFYKQHEELSDADATLLIKSGLQAGFIAAPRN
ncbi:hypothetical protein KWG64_18460 [Rahnella sp. PD12R]|uniref:hypothetical protein n=1 Tax=Rahnella sp. PD12R TaxID=2855688 RepID=UPI001C482CDE|nr:hypothetical protein [Rahnella sp. PD12R]MBV6819930.1 hypothetical protein [Rahnella sp. PD12R]